MYLIFIIIIIVNITITVIIIIIIIFNFIFNLKWYFIYIYYILLIIIFNIIIYISYTIYTIYIIFILLYFTLYFTKLLFYKANSFGIGWASDTIVHSALHSCSPLKCQEIHLMLFIHLFSFLYFFFWLHLLPAARTHTIAYWRADSYLERLVVGPLFAFLTPRRVFHVFRWRGSSSSKTEFIFSDWRFSFYRNRCQRYPLPLSREKIKFPKQENRKRIKINAQGQTGVAPYPPVTLLSCCCNSWRFLAHWLRWNFDT